MRTWLITLLVAVMVAGSSAMAACSKDGGCKKDGGSCQKENKDKGCDKEKKEGCGGDKGCDKENKDAEKKA
ncbi:MAG: hypothetical protein ABFD91_01210 [Anaerohalosphaeraceae bacterium]